MGGIQPNSLRRQAYRYLASRVGRTVHVDQLARHLRIDLNEARGIERARKPIYDLIKRGDIEVQNVVSGSAWKIVAVIEDVERDEEPEVAPERANGQPAAPVVTHPTGANVLRSLEEALADAVVPPAPDPAYAVYVQVGVRESGAPVVKASNGALYYLTKL